MKQSINIQEFEILEKKAVGTFGTYNMTVKGVATINGENYTVCYYRTEPKGYVRIIDIKLPEVTTENTLCADVIEDEIQDYLNG